MTDADGYVTFYYTGTRAGADNLQARFSGGAFAPEVEQKNWVQIYLEIEHVGAELFDDEANAAVNQDGDEHTVQVSLVNHKGDVLRGFGNIDATLWIEGETGGTFLTGAAGANEIELVDGVAQFTYQYNSSSADDLGDVHDLSATLDIAEGTDNEIESNTIHKIWYAPAPWNLVLSAGQQYPMEAPAPTAWDGIDVTAYVTDQYGQELPAGVPVTFTYVSSDPAGQGALQDTATGNAVAQTVALTEGNSEAVMTVVSDRDVDDRPLDTST